jgi:hypothetical protein
MAAWGLGAGRRGIVKGGPPLIPDIAVSQDLFDFGNFFFQEFADPQTEGKVTASEKFSADELQGYLSLFLIHLDEFRPPCGKLVKLRLETFKGGVHPFL